MKKNIKFSFDARTVYLYKKSTDIMESYFDVSIFNKRTKIYGFDEEGKSYCYSVSTFLKRIERGGYWGFCRGKKEIHLWFDKKKIDFEDLLSLVGHEIGHTNRPFHRSEQEEEVKAGKYSNIVVLSYSIANKLWNE